MNKIERMDVDLIHVSERQRKINDERVAALVASIREIGLKTPISVRLVEKMDIPGEGEVHGVPVLIAGAHRLQAMKALGSDSIEVIVLDASEADAQLWEIDENLARAELTTEEKREHLRRRKKLWEERLASSGTQRPTTPKGGRPKEFAADTADATGLSKRQINRLLAEPKPKPTALPSLAQEDVNAAKIQADVKGRAASEVAQILAEHIPADLWDGLKANLYAAGAASIANALTNITGLLMLCPYPRCHARG